MFGQDASKPASRAWRQRKNVVACVCLLLLVFIGSLQLGHILQLRQTPRAFFTRYQLFNASREPREPVVSENPEPRAFFTRYQLFNASREPREPVVSENPEDSELFAYLNRFFRDTKPPPATSATPWLTIGIPSRPRPDAVEHKKMLRQLVQSLQQPNNQSSYRAHLLIVNNAPFSGGFPALEELVSETTSSFVEFHDNPYIDTMLELSRGWSWGSKIHPSVRRQMFDVLSILMIAYSRVPVSSLYMFHEDDFVGCPGALEAIRHGVRQANRLFALCTSRSTTTMEHNGLKSWRGIRFTYGMAGIVVPAAGIPSIARYMLTRIERVPCDHALVEWILGEGQAPFQSDVCPYFALRYNVFDHLGDKLSTFDQKQNIKRPKWPICHGEMITRGVFRQGERFEPQECPNADMFPCVATISKRRAAASSVFPALPRPRMQAAESPAAPLLKLLQQANSSDRGFSAGSEVGSSVSNGGAERGSTNPTLSDTASSGSSTINSAAAVSSEQEALRKEYEAQRQRVVELEREMEALTERGRRANPKHKADPPTAMLKAWREQERPRWPDAHPPILPLPRAWTNGSSLSLVSQKFEFRLLRPAPAQAQELLQAFKRYTGTIFQQQARDGDRRTEECRLGGLIVSVELSGFELDLGTDESYELFLPDRSATGDCPPGGLRGTLKAKTQVGALRGLETFSQLVWFSRARKEYVVRATPWHITDAPRFPHRELMLDTSRHFFPVQRLKGVISAMAMAKLNVFHWHITDEQSFPLPVEGHPRFSNGAFSDMERYTTEDIASLVEWGKLNGVRVIPEVDMPSHTQSWCKGHPEMCAVVDGPYLCALSPIHPTTRTPQASNATYQIIQSILKELPRRFSDRWLHVGVDEVVTDCWNSSAEVREWMRRNDLDQRRALEQFIADIAAMVRAVGKTPVMWGDAFLQAQPKLQKDVIFQVWRHDPSVWKRMIRAGHRLIISHVNSYYLDWRQKPWEQVWRRDPCGAFTKEECKSVLGAGLAVWSESVDPSNVDQVLWPRAAGGAEALWSGRGERAEGLPLYYDEQEKGDQGREDAARRRFRPRLHRFRCLLLWRGVGAEPTNKESGEANNWGSLCPKFPGSCFAE